MSFWKAICFLAVLCTSFEVYADGPPKTFFAAKKYLADLHEQIGHLETIYCGCPYVRTTESGGNIDREACGLKGRKDEVRSDRIEWEHVVPASWFGQTRACWQLKSDAYPECGSKSGRQCCEAVDEHFALAHNDPNNLFPSSGEVNGDRSNYPYGEVEGEPREYGACDFEIQMTLGGKVAEPAAGPSRGTLARAMLYMAEVYGVDVKLDMKTVYEWNTMYPPEAWEIERAHRIANDTGLLNHWVLNYRR